MKCSAVAMKNIVRHGVRNGPDWCHWPMPAAQIARLAHQPLVSEFMVTWSGYFPRCSHNAAWRPNPLREAVFAVCVEGRGWIRDIDNPENQIPVREGEVFVVPPNVPHSYGADKKDPWTQLWFHAMGPRVGQFLTQLGVKDAPFKGRPTKLNMVKDSLHRINELRQQGCGRTVLLETAALAELVLARLYAEACLEPVGRAAKNGEHTAAGECARKLKAITTYFHDNFQREFSVGDIAQVHHVSESWLSHAFSDHTGFSPLGFVIHLRLQEACRALATSDRKLEDIAQSVGYRDPFFFSRLFKKHVGMPPSAYRSDYAR